MFSKLGNPLKGNFKEGKLYHVPMDTILQKYYVLEAQLIDENIYVIQHFTEQHEAAHICATENLFHTSEWGKLCIFMPRK